MGIPPSAPWSRGIGLSALAVFAVLALLAAVLRGGSGARPPAEGSPGRTPLERAAGLRRALVAELLRALAQAVQGKDSRAVAEITSDLARQGDESVAQTLAAFPVAGSWNLQMAYLEVLARIPSAASVGALQELYGPLRKEELALKFEIVRRLARLGGLGREALLGLLPRESDEPVRAEIARTLTAIGATPEEVARLGERERALLEPSAKGRQELRARVEALEKLDPASEADLSALKRAAAEEPVLAIAMIAFRKLEKRDDAEAAAALLERARAGAETPAAKNIQTNALAALARMKGPAARAGMREFVLSGEKGIRQQAIDLVGAFGDEAMLPVLEEVRKSGSPEIREAALRAAAQIRSRASWDHPSKEKAP